jgi:predicted dehydrogenase
LVVKALKAGKHVFVEKPLAINSEQLSVISKQLLRTDHCLLMTGFNRRFSPLAKNLKSLISNLQEPKRLHYRVNAGFIPADHWTQDPAIGGGRIIGEACHFIELITFLVGAPPVRVNAVALPNHGKYSDDNVSMTFTFPDGSIGVVDYLANGDKSMPKERLEVFCEGKIAVLDDYVKLEIVENGKRKVESGAQDKGWRGEMVTFAESIKSGKAPPIPYEQMIGVTKSTFAVVESIREKRSIDI